MKRGQFSSCLRRDEARQADARAAARRYTATSNSTFNYVLPVFYADRFIARLDSRLEGKTWTISRWWWEADVTPDEELRAALHKAVEQFLHYLSADAVHFVTAPSGW